MTDINHHEYFDTPILVGGERTTAHLAHRSHGHAYLPGYFLVYRYGTRVHSTTIDADTDTEAKSKAERYLVERDIQLLSRDVEASFQTGQ
jgi:hypothetical protein